MRQGLSYTPIVPLSAVVIACCSTLAMLGLFLWRDGLSLFDFNPEFIVQQPWRWWSAHFVHLNITHLLGNLVAFIAIVVVFAPVWQRGALLWVLIASSTFSTALVWVAPGSASFAGLSGALHGLALYGLLCMRTQHWAYLLGLVAVTTKLLLELSFVYLNTYASGSYDSAVLSHLHELQAISQWLEAPTAYLAHIGGSLGGMVAWFVSRYGIRSSGSRNTESKSSANKKRPS